MQRNSKNKLFETKLKKVKKKKIRFICSKKPINWSGLITVNHKTFFLQKL